jgi:hypothetical protein
MGAIGKLELGPSDPSWSIVLAVREALISGYPSSADASNGSRRAGPRSCGRQTPHM